MGKIKSFFFCSIFYFSFLSLSFSQTITLKSGQKIEGKIIEQTDKYVKVEFEGVELIFYNDEIFSIDQTSSAGANTITPEMELLYKAYTASLNTTQSTKTETKVVSGADLLEKAKVDTVVSSSQKDVDSPESVDLLPLPLPDQNKIKPTVVYLPKDKHFKTEDKQ